MAGIIICCFLVIIQNAVFGEAQDAAQPPDPLSTTRDPYANVFSQLSDVIFDVEDRLYRLTAPKQESGNLRTLSSEEKDNRRRNYFDRIRDNYKSLQDRVSDSLSSGGSIKMSDILNLNFQNKGARSSLDLSLPFLPLSIQVDSKKPPATETGEKTDKDGLKLLPPLPDVSGNINLGLHNILNTETAGRFEQKDSQLELQKRSSRPTRSTSTANKKLSNKGKSSAEISGGLLKPNIEQRQDWEDESAVQDRILGDILFSESTFDKYFRQFLKGPGKWLLDSVNILPPKQIIENIRDATRNQFSTSTSSKGSPQVEKAGGDKKEPKLRGQKHPESVRHGTDSKIILVFTPEGVPLKLKMDPSVKPLKFLHKILSEAKVSLNIPVSTTKGIQPAGNGVLHLGYEESGMPSRTPLLDLADDNQLSYLLRTLRKLKS